MNDIDECRDTKPCDTHYDCTNFYGGYNCTCDDECRKRIQNGGNDDDVISLENGLIVAAIVTVLAILSALLCFARRKFVFQTCKRQSIVTDVPVEMPEVTHEDTPLRPESEMIYDEITVITSDNIRVNPVIVDNYEEIPDSAINMNRNPAIESDKSAERDINESTANEQGTAMPEVTSADAPEVKVEPRSDACGYLLSECCDPKPSVTSGYLSPQCCDSEPSKTPEYSSAGDRINRWSATQGYSSSTCIGEAETSSETCGYSMPVCCYIEPSVAAREALNDILPTTNVNDDFQGSDDYEI